MKKTVNEKREYTVEGYEAVVSHVPGNPGGNAAAVLLFISLQVAQVQVYSVFADV